MPILEILQLRIKPEISPSDPSVLKSLQSVRSKLAANITNTRSRFYQSIEDLAIIFVFGEWPSLEAHRAFLASPKREAALEDQEAWLDFKWVVHMAIEGIDELPFDAPVMAIERLYIKGGEHVTEFQQKVEKYRDLTAVTTRPHNVVDGWRCDSEEGKQEYLVFTGWGSATADDAFKQGKKSSEIEAFGAMRDLCEGIEILHATDMES